MESGVALGFSNIKILNVEHMNSHAQTSGSGGTPRAGQACAFDGRGGTVEGKEKSRYFFHPRLSLWLSLNLLANSRVFNFFCFVSWAKKVFHIKNVSKHELHDFFLFFALNLLRKKEFKVFISCFLIPHLFQNSFLYENVFIFLHLCIVIHMWRDLCTEYNV